MTATPQEVVDQFIAAFATKDIEAVMALVDEDCYYDNVPVGDMRGHAAMREFLAPMLSSPDPVTFEVHRSACTGNVVFNERTDHMVMKGRPIAIPVAGVFEVNDGRITFWRDYFDNGMFMSQLKG